MSSANAPICNKSEILSFDRFKHDRQSTKYTISKEKEITDKEYFKGIQKTIYCILETYDTFHTDMEDGYWFIRTLFYWGEPSYTYLV